MNLCRSPRLFRCSSLAIRNRVRPGRLYSTPADLETWISSLTNREPEITHDFIDVDRSTQLLRVLPTRQLGDYIGDVPTGTHLCPGHHLIFFRPKPMLRDLGPDGSSVELNAPPPFTRRMWAGGSMIWSETNSLQVGSPVTQALNIPRVEHKKGMIFVHQQRVLYPGIQETASADGWALKETRIHVFRAAQQAVNPVASADPSLAHSSHSHLDAHANRDDDVPYRFSYTPTSPLLFLYSALTHNPHKIHYDQCWSIAKEGQRGPLVHGPLTATLLVELAGQVESKKLKEFNYRATSPMVLDEEIRMTGRWSEDGVLMLEAKQGFKVGMKATATFV
ncbi:hypothetical protein I307_05788 [Cryptococcus deuterogattii 99/473]|uniref:Uncharacterized protein n=2 Tax=Cryptococcus deuterogattii TaxID=1859096 RepID=A0A0D0SWN1_9TREE|nr:hypothetical protein CNBG_6139 [Cryptococcus deuterogattii R265]KIR25574.1 hypothetical protein I309_05630 [Cryptococcus deuterogattii LA55]KIR37562.1 hypothetical protein I313_06564 [Cryptococcus deuterogattii Ram5]KIR69854.1 hypothetical protein I310_06419 [Cryptococcus deuterogattii CA1014]KIR89738.1 hypothetical protein I304_06457 [Cryptococcus deuterogattii CBS 10090]KIR96189.1 hypothetical protein L804_06525 [Cryptococcus deuterogattii 2001/935-1]KIY54915.1 hypothetical protein I307_